MVNAAFEQASDAMIITDAAEKIVRVNRKFTSLTGYEAEEVLGQTPAILRSGKNDPKLFTNVWNAINTTGQWQGEIWNRKKNGRLFVAELTISAIINHHSKASYYLGVYRDITAAKEEQLKKQQQETREAHTFLLNRPAFFQHLSEFCASCGKPANGQGALLLMNLDHFRDINDLYGVSAGDDVLYEAARRLRKSLRDSDIIGRLDGDEFAVIIQGLASESDIAKVTDKILERLTAPYDLGNRKHVTVSCSIGLAPLNGKACQSDTLLRQASQAMRDAKRKGGGKWRRASVEAETESV
ncbi:MAG: diguanylate cyclase [Burkholderiaceae bacterium]|nr:diguanylate cyclase [Burkholderiaceae bacterium]